MDQPGIRNGFDLVTDEINVGAAMGRFNIERDISSGEEALAAALEWNEEFTSTRRGSTLMDSVRYIGLDVHRDAVSAAVLDREGKVVMQSVLATRAHATFAGGGGAGHSAQSSRIAREVRCSLLDVAQGMELRAVKKFGSHAGQLGTGDGVP